MLELNESNFNGEIASKTVVTDFWASWCSPCRAIAPKFKQWSVDYGHLATFAKVNIDDAGSLATEHNVSAIPTVILFKEGKEVVRWVGLPTEKDLLKYIG